MKKLSACLALLVIALSALPAIAADAVREHPVIKCIPGSTPGVDYCVYKDFHYYEFPVIDPETGYDRTTKVSGRYWELYYEFLKDDGNRDNTFSGFETLLNYKAAALELGGTIEVDNPDGSQLCFSLPSASGAKTWAHLRAEDGYYYLWIVEEKGFEKQLTFSADELKAELDLKGAVALYGINFDLDKATLRPESLKALGEMAILMLRYPELKIEIQGHTDSQGADDYNLALSKKRADAVKSFLLLFDIAPDRLTSKGLGETMPVATNDSEEGRAKNRRVELHTQ